MSDSQGFVKYSIFVSWQEEGYMVEYSLSQREIPRAELKWFPKGSGYNSEYIPTRKFRLVIFELLWYLKNSGKTPSG